MVPFFQGRQSLRGALLALLSLMPSLLHPADKVPFYPMNLISLASTPWETPLPKGNLLAGNDGPLLSADTQRFAFSWLNLIPLTVAKREPSTETRQDPKAITLVNRNGFLTCLLGKRVKWQRWVGQAKVVHFASSNNVVGVLFENGIFRTFSKGGDLKTWTYTDFSARWVYPSKNGFLIFATERFFHFRTKDSLLESRELPMVLSAPPLLREGELYLAGVHKKAPHLVLACFQGARTVRVTVPSGLSLRRGSTLTLKVEDINVEKAKITFKLMVNDVVQEEEKRSSRKEFSFYMALQGKGKLEYAVEGKEYKREGAFEFTVQ